MSRLSLAVLALAFVGAVASAQVGAPFPQAQFRDFAQTEAQSWSDFQGRVVLVEVFAFW